MTPERAVRSCLYVGKVRHRRMSPTSHAFTFPLFMVLLDLAEVETVFRGRWLWSTRRPAVARFKRSDYLGPTEVPLDQAVRDRVESATGVRPTGPIRLLTHLRYLGYVFNPVSFYYVYDVSDTRVETIVAEITNTPWKERHAYVLRAEGAVGVEGAERAKGAAGPVRFRFGKAFHVSPFMPMEVGYDWTFTRPDDDLFIHMNLVDQPAASGEGAAPKVFDATLTLRRRPITGANLAGVLVMYPLMTLRVIARIHFEALRLWLKGVPIHAHPKTRSRASSSAAPTISP